MLGYSGSMGVIIVVVFIIVMVVEFIVVCRIRVINQVRRIGCICILERIIVSVLVRLLFFKMVLNVFLVLIISKILVIELKLFFVCVSIVFMFICWWIFNI